MIIGTAYFETTLFWLFFLSCSFINERDLVSTLILINYTLQKVLSNLFMVSCEIFICFLKFVSKSFLKIDLVNNQLMLLRFQHLLSYWVTKCRERKLNIADFNKHYLPLYFISPLLPDRGCNYDKLFIIVFFV